MKEYNKMYLIAQGIAIAILLLGTLCIWYLENMEIPEDEKYRDNIIRTRDNLLENMLSVRFVLLIVVIGSNIFLGICLGFIYLIKKLDKHLEGR